MRLETVLFDKESSYGTFTEVLKHTAKLNSPHTPLTVHEITDDDHEFVSQACPYVWEKTSYLDNARKTKYHNQIVQDAKNGDEICLLDCDTFILRSMNFSDMKRMNFDLAITHRPKNKYPVNTGVVFVRVSERTKRWYADWLRAVERLMREKDLIIKYHPKFGGINQSALGMLRERLHDLCIVRIPCEEWNLTSDLHHKYKEGQTRLVHIHGALRHRIVNHSPTGGPIVHKLAELWRSYEKQCCRTTSA